MSERAQLLRTILVKPRGDPVPATTGREKTKQLLGAQLTKARATMSDDEFSGKAPAQPETFLAEAERHVRECEAHVTDQMQFTQDLHADGYHEAETTARTVLALLVDALDAARKLLESERRRTARPG